MHAHQDWLSRLCCSFQWDASCISKLFSARSTELLLTGAFNATTQCWGRAVAAAPVSKLTRNQPLRRCALKGEVEAREEGSKRPASAGCCCSSLSSKLLVAFPLLFAFPFLPPLPSLLYA
eukprot:3939968-Amphidinium_carterae.2